jgi:hypothetical protein
MSTTTDDITTPRTFHTLATWRRLGSEDYAADAVRAQVEPLDADELRGTGIAPAPLDFDQRRAQALSRGASKYDPSCR